MLSKNSRIEVDIWKPWKEELFRRKFGKSLTNLPFFRIMADKEVLFAIKQQIMSVEDLIKERKDQKIQQAAKEAMKI